jgi:hypothetical protein
MFDLNEMHMWLLATAVIFTFVGRYMARSSIKRLMYEIAHKESTRTIESVVDKLIEDGYIKTKIVDGEVELVKHYEE